MGSEAPVERGLGELPGDIGYQCRDQDVEQRMGEHAGAGRANQPKRVKPPKGRQEDKGDRDQNNAEGAPDHADRAWPRRRGRVVSAQHLAEAAAECPVDHRQSHREEHARHGRPDAGRAAGHDARSPTGPR